MIKYPILYIFASLFFALGYMYLFHTAIDLQYYESFIFWVAFGLLFSVQFVSGFVSKKIWIIIPILLMVLIANFRALYFWQVESSGWLSYAIRYLYLYLESQEAKDLIVFVLLIIGLIANVIAFRKSQKIIESD